MYDVREDWFMKQHFSTEELEQLHTWETKSGSICKIVQEQDGFKAFHIEDTENIIDLCFMTEREMLLRWISRINYKTIDGETYKGD